MKHLLGMTWILLLFINCNGQRCHELKLKSIKTTMMEAGSLNPAFDLEEVKKEYRGSKFILCPQNSYFIILGKGKKDTIFLAKTEKISKVIDDETLRKYPTDNLDECIEKGGNGCGISKTLQSMLEQKDANIYYSTGKAADFDETSRRYVLFYLAHKRYALLSNNDFVLFLFSGKQ